METGQIQKEIKQVFEQIKLKQTKKGYQYLVVGVTKFVQNEALYQNQIYRRLFEEIAKEFQTTPSCVERNIRTILESTWTNEYAKEQYVYYDCILKKGDKPSAADFIIRTSQIIKSRINK